MTLRVLTFVLLAALVGCGPTFKRASEDPEIDEDALSTRLDRVDLELALDEWLASFDGSPVANAARTAREKPNIAILSIVNDTSEHISSALDNLLNSAETKLVQSGDWNVIDNTTVMADAVLAERVRNLSETVDPATVAALGREYGIHYFINGRVGETAEKTGDRKRVQYYLFLRVTDVATLRIVWQEQIDITKQVEG